MRGRKKIQNPKSEHIRISIKARHDLLELRKILNMPLYYKENEIIEGLISLVKSQLCRMN